MFNMKRMAAIAVALAVLIASCASAAPAESAGLVSAYASHAADTHTNAPLMDEAYRVNGDTVSISILTTTDMHGRVYDTDAVGKPVENNLLQAAQIIADRRAAADDSILMDNGDLYDGTMTMASIFANRGGKDIATAAARLIGYDVFNPGNHEFNYTPEIQWSFYNDLESASPDMPGKPVSVVCANVLENDTNKPVFSPYKLFPYEFDDGTVFTVGVICFENNYSVMKNPIANYEGCSFKHIGTGENFYKDEYAHWKKELEEKADFIIVMIHSGSQYQEKDGTIEPKYPDSAVAFMLDSDNVDLVIAGHDHEEIAGRLENAAGKQIPFINAAGKNVGEIVLTLRNDGGKITPSLSEPVLHPLAPDAKNSASDRTDAGSDAGEAKAGIKEGEAYRKLKEQLEPLYNGYVEKLNTPMGTAGEGWECPQKSSYYEQTDSVTFIAQVCADIAAKEAGVDPDTQHVVCLLQPSITVRPNDMNQPFFNPGQPITANDVFSRIKYLLNSLYMVKMTGKQLTDWLNQCARTYTIKPNKTTGEKALYLGNGSSIDHAYGVNYRIIVGPNAEENHIENLTWPDGTPVRDDDTVYACVTSYRMCGGDDIDTPWYRNTGISDRSGNIVWDSDISPRYAQLGGFMPFIVLDHIDGLTADGKKVEPERKTRWSIIADLGASDVEAAEEETKKAA